MRSLVDAARGGEHTPKGVPEEAYSNGSVHALLLSGAEQ